VTLWGLTTGKSVCAPFLFQDQLDDFGLSTLDINIQIDRYQGSQILCSETHTAATSKGEKRRDSAVSDTSKATADKSSKSKESDMVKTPQVAPQSIP
jgi:hypothetical protein